MFSTMLSYAPKRVCANPTPSHSAKPRPPKLLSQVTAELSQQGETTGLHATHHNIPGKKKKDLSAPNQSGAGRQPLDYKVLFQSQNISSERDISPSRAE